MLCRFCAYQEKTKEILKTDPTEIPNPIPEDFNKKCLALLTDIAGEWYLNSMRNPKPPMKKSRLIKKKQEE